MPVKPTAEFMTAESDAPVWAVPANGATDDDEPMVDPVPLDTAFAVPDDFFKVDLAVDHFYIPEMQRKVRLRYLTAKEVDAYRQSLIIGRGNNIQINQRGARAKLAVMALANEDGSRMFRDADVNQVMRWHSIILERIADRVKSKNGITDEDMGGDDAGN